MQYMSATKHPTNKAQRRKVALKKSRKHFLDYFATLSNYMRNRLGLDVSAMIDQPFRWSKQDHFDCGNPNCGVCSNFKYDKLKAKGYKPKLK